MVAIIRRTFKLACAPNQSKAFISAAIKRLSTTTNTPSYWDYSPSHGPTEWSKTWPTSGTRQSPIDLCTKTAVYDSNLQSFILDKKPVSFTATNLGNNVSMTPHQGSEILLQNGPLPNAYRFAEMHMHWGEVTVCGCEHTLDGERFAGELHLVHWNTRYVEQPQAMDKPDGLAVLGVWLDAQEDHPHHPGLDLILDMFGRVSQEGSQTKSASEFSPYQLLPAKQDSFFTYLGSLTTPPLLESVVWTVFMEPIKISMKQWTQLNGVTTSKGPHGGDRFCKQCATSTNSPSVISNNFREVQDLKGRVVRSSVNLVK
ncbi:carbonic anhydrase 1-like [Clytia hemisphaerica]|uniref:carbonic anhydrase 1-like n=1 Tax=Clytia hemisphaerica TaxID=252671 RepID=UPI0034D5F0B9